jgi:GrpB-like predicted nucleotidyltransferase (UPF0157 family)
MTDQRVDIVGYDPRWPGLFAEERPSAEALVAPWLCRPVDHVGSTAVPGLRAKAVIDMPAPVRSLTAAVAAVPVIEGAGWMPWPQDPLRGAEFVSRVLRQAGVEPPARDLLPE